MPFDSQAARRAQDRFTRLFLRLPDAADPNSVLADAVGRLRGVGGLLRAGLYEVMVHADARLVEVRCGWAESDRPGQEGQKTSLWSILEGFSVAFNGAVAVGLAIDGGAEHLQFELIEGGRRVRTLIYNREAGGWARSTGRVQQWEREVFFPDEDQREALARAATDAEKEEVSRIFSFVEVKLELLLPFPGARIAADRILRALDLPSSSSSPSSTAIQLPPTTWVRIVRPPSGDAPEWVRKAWLGMALPQSLHVSKAEQQSSPTLMSKVRGFFGGGQRPGHDVDTQVALGLLEHHASEAAQWWRSRPIGPLLRFDARACEPVPPTHSARREDYGVLWADHAQWLYAQGQYGDAESFGVAALAAFEVAGQAYVSQQLKVMNNLGTVYRRLGRHEEAVLALEECASRHEAATWPGATEGLRAVMNNLATAYSFAGRAEDAGRAWERCLSMSPTPPDEETARVLDNTVSHALSTSKELGPEIRDRAERARKVWVELVGEDAPDTAISGVVLGTVELRMRHYEEARKWVVSSIATLTKHLGEKHPELCGALNVLGAVELGAGRLAEAQQALARSFEIGHSVLGEASPQVIEAAEGLRALELLKEARA